MLRDLREVYLKASGVSVDWEMLAQAAQGAKQQELLELALSPGDAATDAVGQLQAQNLLDPGPYQLMTDS